ncbi:MAG: Hsp20/alpha crystallin family protein [Gammaproteobacteria bacterium]|nr:Hsp20/alpha crystallin family protein [Gammaproteobacteria bacterium]
MTEASKLPARRGVWSPFGDDMDHLFEGFFRPISNSASDDGVLTPAVDVIERDTTFEIKVNIPGVKKEDIHVSIHDGVLAVDAEAKSDEEHKEGDRVIRRERRYGRFSRVMRLGTEVDESKLNASYDHGVLTVIAPKAKQATPKKIEIH